MATTVANFSAIDDTEVDADSPITESLVTRMRDNSYWIIAGTNKTTETTQGVYLRTADTAGTLEWAAAGVDGTKGSINTAALTQTWTTITTSTSGILQFTYSGPNSAVTRLTRGTVTVDLSDDSFVGEWQYVLSATVPNVTSGTITTGSNVGKIYVSASTTLADLRFRRDSGNFQYSGSAASNMYLVANWVIL